MTVDVVFQIENGKPVEVSANTGDRIFDIARSANIAIDAPCSGNGACGKCLIKILKGSLKSVQTGHISDEDYADGWRLACMSRIADSDVTVMVPDIASAYKSRMKTADLSDDSEIEIFRVLQEHMQSVGLGISNGYDKVVLHMDEPTLDDTLPDNERLENAVSAATGNPDVHIRFYALRHLAGALRDNHFTVTAIYEKVGHHLEVLDIAPTEEKVRICGVAIDIGTTTVTGVLTDLKTGKLLSKASAGNGQIRFGADVINRIVEQNKPGGVLRLQKAIVDETLIPMIQTMLHDANIKRGQVVRVAIAGNTTMNHLLMGVYADPVRTEPYIPSFYHLRTFKASNLLPSVVNPQADVYISPNIGSYVGGDITSGTMASMIWNMETFSLFIDLGTNGEIVFGNNEFLMSCACSAGPAFEGGDISCGMRATDGAVEAVTIDPETMEPSMKVVGDRFQRPVGICGSGIIDIISELYRCGIIDSKGKFVREGERIIRDQHGTAKYVLAWKDQTATNKMISINEVDIESFIRAKAAIYSAIDTMLGTLEFTPDIIDNIYVAGGIGSGINIENAIRIGMFPDVEREKFHYIGNSSLAGAYAMVLSDPAFEKVGEIARNMTYIELSTYPGYMDRFIAACFIPHTDAALFPSSTQIR